MLEVRGLCKAFPGVQALDNVDAVFRAGEIHALMGENGAGKSTLINILSGLIPADSGQIILAENPVNLASPIQAESLGISTVHQELALAPNLSIAENICLGREPRKWSGIDWKQINRRAKEAMGRLGQDIDISLLVRDASAAERQCACIARALDIDAKVVILDEPTSSLDSREVEVLFRILSTLRAQHICILFVTHFLDQVFEIADRTTVLRNGQLVGTFEIEKISKQELVRAMIGRDVEFANRTRSFIRHDAKPIFEAHNVSSGTQIRNISISLKPGESIGLAGLLGSGRTESLRTLFGLEPVTSGYVTFDGMPFVSKDRIRHGVAMMPEDRKTEGIVPDLSVAENILLSRQVKQGWLRRVTNISVEDLKKRFAISAANLNAPITTLSGGNQQKVILARIAAMSPRLLFADEPTRGVDVAARVEIERQLDELCANGTAMIAASTDIAELMRISQQIAVLRDRRWIAAPSNYASANDVLEAIAGGPN